MRTRQRQSGQAMVEGALVMLVFLVTIMGIADMGQLMFFHQSLVERARSAVRWGVTHTYNQTQIQNMAVYEKQAPTQSDKPVLAYLTTGMVTVTNDNAGTTQASRTVSISGYPYRFISPWITKSFNSTKPVVATMPVEVP